MYGSWGVPALVAFYDKARKLLGVYSKPQNLHGANMDTILSGVFWQKYRGMRSNMSYTQNINALTADCDYFL